MPHSITQLTVTSTADLADLTRLLRSFPVRVTNHGTDGGIEVLTPAELPERVRLQLAQSLKASIYVPDRIGCAHTEVDLANAVKRYGFPLELWVSRIGGKRAPHMAVVNSDADIEAFCVAEKCRGYINYRRPIPA